MILIIIQTFIKQAFTKRASKKSKVTISSWLMEVLDEHGVDTSGYVINGCLPTDIDSPQSHYSEPDTQFDEGGNEPLPRSPCLKAVAELTEGGNEPLPRSPCVKTNTKLIKNSLSPPLAEHRSKPTEGRTVLPDYSKVRIRSPSQSLPLLRELINMNSSINLNFKLKMDINMGGV